MLVVVVLLLLLAAAAAAAAVMIIVMVTMSHNPNISVGFRSNVRFPLWLLTSFALTRNMESYPPLILCC